MQRSRDSNLCGGVLLLLPRPFTTMATVHPSRMGLVPQDPKQTQKIPYYRRSPSPRRNRSATPSRSRSRDGGRNGRDKDTHRGSYRGTRDDIRGRDHIRDNPRDGHRDGDRRRGSPQYDDYRRPPPSVEGQAPWRQPENMYPNRRGMKSDRPHGGAGPDFMERFVVHAMTLYIK